MVDRWRALPFSGLDPLRELSDMQGEINRVFDAYFGPRGRPALLERSWTPPLDVYETRDELIVSVELPGVREKDVHLAIVGDVLSLRGQRAANGEVREENYHRIERWSGSFERHVQLPIAVQADRVRATYKDGVLDIRLPKLEEVKPREIPIEPG